MPTWLYNAITVLNPVQAMGLAAVGALSMIISLMVERPTLKVMLMGLFVVGGWGFANLLGPFAAR